MCDKPETKADEALVQVLRRDYVPDIKDEVSELLKEALRARTPSESQKTSGPSTNSSTATADQRRTVATFRSPHYDVAKDIGNQRANLFCNQLLEDNKTYRKMLMLSLRRPRKPCTVKLLEIYHVTGEDLGPPEIDVEIGGCTIFRVPVNSGSGVNIMTEETAHSLGFHTFEPTTRVLRLADQTRRMPLEILRDIKTIIGGVAFPLIYIILQPPMKRGYDVLIGRPWLYGARVRCDWQRKRLQFRDPSNSSTVITVPWVKIPHEGETPSTSLGYTSAEDNTSSDDEGWEVGGRELREIQAFLRQYEDVFAWRIEEMKGIPARYEEHQIDLLDDAIPILQGQYRFNPKYSLLVKEEIDKYLSAGIIYPVLSSDSFAEVSSAQAEGSAFGADASKDVAQDARGMRDRRLRLTENDLVILYAFDRTPSADPPLVERCALSERTRLQWSAFGGSGKDKEVGGRRVFAASAFGGRHLRRNQD
ncbi:hypothetical protein AXG93_3805s1000 [Marchantia polymorpha subsp. ruderalis]|uniref:Uncharacterized protein n=1 Tax=Marchantia polymorpha subsp. ruderalis TaxID=1480154 RepID=A0A176WMZ8_MARPO|nr:hypothetical protein AXG93_3805s1000 [Marchantia polymorpha subsp. ruderalis]